MGGDNLYAYAPNPIVWVASLGLQNEFGIAGYKDKSYMNDNLDAHELIQNALLRQNRKLLVVQVVLLRLILRLQFN